MLRLLIRLTAVVIVASLPVPLYAQVPPPPAPPVPPIDSLVARAAEMAAHAATWSAMSWRESWEAKQGPETIERVNKSFKVGPTGTLDIGNVSGDVVVNEGGTDTIVVDAVKKFRGAQSDAKDQLARTQVTMEERAGRVEVRTVYDRSTRNIKTSVDYTVTAPAGTTVFAHSVSGDVRVSNIKGEVRADTVSGDVTATNTPGATLVKTVSGDATVSGVSNGNELRVSSISGDVTVNGAKARAIDADSISGDVHMTSVACDRASAKSISGDITFGGGLVKAGRYEFKSQSGNIQLTLAGAPGFELDANSFSGNVRSDLPITLRAGEQAGGRGPGKKIRGTHGDGSAQLVLTSFSGDIVIAVAKK
jgi:DUF4097 and DUF4098 domain-containing protein YvlB